MTIFLSLAFVCNREKKKEWGAFILKKLFCAVFMAILCFSLAACSSSKNDVEIEYGEAEPSSGYEARESLPSTVYQGTVETVAEGEGDGSAEPVTMTIGEQGFGFLDVEGEWRQIHLNETFVEYGRESSLYVSSIKIANVDGSGDLADMLYRYIELWESDGLDNYGGGGADVGGFAAEYVENAQQVTANTLITSRIYAFYDADGSLTQVFIETTDPRAMTALSWAVESTFRFAD